MIKIEDFNFNDYKTIDIPIDENYTNIHQLMFDLGYSVYDSLSSKKMHVWKQIYTNGKKYYIISSVSCKHTFIRYITLADLTDLIKGGI